MPAQPTPPGKVRYTIVMDEGARKDLIRLTEKHELSQTDVLETMIAHATLNPEGWTPIFKEAREQKVVGRKQKRIVLERLSKLDPKELERVLAAVQAKP